MHARITTMQYPPHRHDEVARVIQEEIVPYHQRLDGLVGAHFLLNRETGHGLGIALYETPEHVKASEESVNPKRSEAIAKVGGHVQGIETFEVVGHYWK